MPDKLLRRRNGVNEQYTPLVQSAGAADAGKVPALGPDGKLDPSLYNAGMSEQTTMAVAFEALGAGKFVNLYSNVGVLTARLADNSNGRPAHGFVRTAVASAAQATVFPLDAINGALTGLTVGAPYFLGTAGGVITPALDASAAPTGTIDQKLGLAKSATELVTDDFDYVVL